jgi:KaiC/GvpD/RAD55 family RecA-like ATPase
MKKQEQKNYAELLSQRKYDPDKEPPKEQVVFVIEGKVIGTFQNFITLTGLQKSGKTTFLSAMMASALTGKMILGMKMLLPHEKNRTAYFDTEQGDYDFYRTMERVRVFCETDKTPEHLDSYNLREDEPRDIIWLIKKYLELHPKCGLLVIDGILDLIESFNDESESKRLINMLKAITKQSNCLALLTLHKGKTTSNTLGHLGSMADRAAQSILSVEKIKDRGSFVLKGDYLRSADDFTPIEVIYDKIQHKWVETIYNPEQDAPARIKQLKPFEYDKEHHIANMGKIFLLEEQQRYSTLVQNISEFYAVGRNWAKDCIKHLMKEGVIFKMPNLLYTNRQQAKLYLQ